MSVSYSKYHSVFIPNLLYLFLLFLLFICLLQQKLLFVLFSLILVMNQQLTREYTHTIVVWKSILFLKNPTFH